jgi:CBS domain-containing protein
MQVKDLMTSKPSVCDLSATASDAVRVMSECDCGSVPVVDRGGRAVGIVTDRDICLAAYQRGLPLKSIAVADVMSRDLCTVNAEADVTEAEHLMQARQIRRLPVVARDGRLMGILSLSDVAQGVMHNGSSHQDGRDGVELLSTIEKVTTPRGQARAQS